MELTKLFEEYNKCTDEMRAYAILSCIEEEVKAAKEQIKPGLENGELGTTSFEDIGKNFNLIEMSKATLKEEEIKAQLSDEECRKGLKITEKLLKDLKRNDLLADGYKSYEIVRQIRVSTIKKDIKESA